MAINETLCVFNDPKFCDLFTSFSPDDMDGKRRLYNAINSPDKRLADIINTPINIRDIVVKRVELTEDMSGSDWTKENDRSAAFRVVVIDDQDVSYTATSTGIYNSVCTLRSIFGTLHFDEPLKACVKQIKTKNGNTLTLSLVD